MTPTAQEAREALEDLNGETNPKWADKLTETVLAFIDHAEKLKAENAKLREGLKIQTCPRPINGRADDTTVETCVNAGECGCGCNLIKE